MFSFSGRPELTDQLLRRLAKDHQVFGAVLGKDGICRLQSMRQWRELELETLPLLPAKKFLLPCRDPLWTLAGETYRQPPDPPRIALVGLPPCDLQGLAYLDEVFADDLFYRNRRERLVVVGTECVPGPLCSCPPRKQPPPFDLFLEGERVWVGSDRGEGCLQGLVDESSAADLSPPECLTEGTVPSLPDDLEKLFAGSEGRPLWREVSERCLSCGACSAVCPTCYCYDLVDEAQPDGETTRLREWDNCFFRNHGMVAGGHDFRPTRTERLRFRFEHKLLGFGSLRGTSSCVGCGRCSHACPVDIDISGVLSQLTGEEAS